MSARPQVFPDEDAQSRALRAGHRLPAHGVLGGWAAGVLLGVPSAWLDGRDPHGQPIEIPVVAPPPARPSQRRGVRVSQAHLANDDVVVVSGVPMTSGLRTAFDLIRHASSLRRAVAMGDAALRFRLTRLAALAAYSAERAGWRGVGQVRAALPLLDARAESPPESEVRVVWTQSGLGVPVPQVSIADERGVLAARVDFFDEAAALAGEYMGAWHRFGRRPWSDTVRVRGLDSLGVEVVELWAPDIGTDLRLIHTLRVGYGRAARRDPALRTYVLLRQSTAVAN